MSEEERDQVRLLAKDTDRKMAAMLRVIFREGLRVGISKLKRRQNSAVSALEQLENRADSAPTERRRTYERARKSSSSGEEKRKNKRESKNRARGQAELMGTEPPPVSEPFVREVITHLNEECGTGFPTFSKAVRKLVAQLLVDGYTIEDIKTVNRWADRNWPRAAPGEKDWRATMLVPSRLYGEKFGEHLGVARGTERVEPDEPWRPSADDLLSGAP
ncbi:MAG: hypothetical protein GY838_13285 [bacterium]|nr:hypothetical protein [bacterium]